MLEYMVEWAGQARTAWWVLAGASIIIVVEAVRVSKKALWWDMLEDDE
ncbi:MAG: hypothetical protein AAF613_03955 [Pseudomonadota bacterium]